MNNLKFDWNDVSIVPTRLSDIDHRKEINTRYKNGKLPIFTAPMDTVVDLSNADKFNKDINACLPRNVKFKEGQSEEYFYSYGLDEIINIFNSNSKLPKKILIDIANGHMKKLYDITKEIKRKYKDNIEVMVGNIANPVTYLAYAETGVDYIRVGIGGGTACTTSANSGVHYPMASLVEECREHAKILGDRAPKIVADGGFKNFSDIIKALSLGADYVMLGSILNKTLESCSDTYIELGGQYIIASESDIKGGNDLYKYYRGMSTKEVQKSWGNEELKTSEGISKYNKVEYSLDGLIDNFESYLKTNMSYCGKRNINDFVGKVRYIFMTQNSYNRFNK